MAFYFLSYDVKVKRDYQQLHDELKKFKAIKVLESVYAFECEEDKSVSLRNHFKKLINSDDDLLVIEGRGWAGSQLI